MQNPLAEPNYLETEHDHLWSLSLSLPRFFLLRNFLKAPGGTRARRETTKEPKSSSKQLFPRWRSE
jgi:hypothetical protein